jgi:hypothetical protein
MNSVPVEIRLQIVLVTNQRADQFDSMQGRNLWSRQSLRLPNIEASL